MAVKFGNRVKETTTTTGTGTVTLAGADTGFRGFADEFSTNDDEISYLIVDNPNQPVEYEYGKGTFVTGTFERDTVEGSSNSGSKVDFGAGIKTIIAAPTAGDFTPFTSVISARGDLIRGSSSATAERLALGTSGQVPKSDGTDVAWDWHGVVQQVNTQDGTSGSGTTLIPNDNTVPQNNEGDQYMTQAVTPKSSSNILVIDVVINLSNDAGGHMAVALFQDSTAAALASARALIDTANGSVVMSFRHRMTAGTTSETTFKVRAGNSAAGTTTFNNFHGGVMASSITITEVAA